MEETKPVVPPKYIYDVIPWSFQYAGVALRRLELITGRGWELITISNGFAYFRLMNPDHVEFIEAENRKRLAKRARR